MQGAVHGAIGRCKGLQAAVHGVIGRCKDLQAAVHGATGRCKDLQAAVHGATGRCKDLQGPKSAAKVPRGSLLGERRLVLRCGGDFRGAEGVRFLVAESPPHSLAAASRFRLTFRVSDRLQSRRASAARLFLPSFLLDPGSAGRGWPQLGRVAAFLGQEGAPGGGLRRRRSRPPGRGGGSPPARRAQGDLPPGGPAPSWRSGCW